MPIRPKTLKREHNMYTVSQLKGRQFNKATKILFYTVKSVIKWIDNHKTLALTFVDLMVFEIARVYKTLAIKAYRQKKYKRVDKLGFLFQKYLTSLVQVKA